MRSAIGFLSLLAFGFLAAGVLTVAGSGTATDFSFDGATGIGATGVHLGSLLIGMVLGIVLSALARVSWAELPRRFAGWLLAYERAFYRLALAGVFVGILLFY
ncbi:hypothetical protein [Hyphomicrobium sp.]|uniref:hypothetical protein n=1 Tax=Hyphomicrobium sp. TaxID=82 RepID=UPI0025C3CAF2|nr:hypothetical protein [Hyphomicrobium sp.]MCC7252774.1 hypothetical protein [Hyphomicrobium sp.]